MPLPPVKSTGLTITGNRNLSVAEMAEAEGARSVVISAKIEEELAQLDAEEAGMFLEEMGLDEAGLDPTLETVGPERTGGDGGARQRREDKRDCNSKQLAQGPRFRLILHRDDLS